MVGGNSGQKPVIQQMIDGVNRFQLPNILYQNEVRMFAFKNRFSSSTYQAGMLSNRELVLLPYHKQFCTKLFTLITTRPGQQYLPQSGSHSPSCDYVAVGTHRTLWE